MTDSSDSDIQVWSSAVVICTKSRPLQVANACEAVANDRPTATIVVLDASTDDATEVRCADVAAHYPQLTIHYVRAVRPGLARQRNEAVRFCESIGTEIVHFIDDDIEILPGYLDAIEARFRADRELAGVGGFIENISLESHPRLNSLFLLSGSRPHTIRKSGRIVIAQNQDGARRTRIPDSVDWLLGGSMSYRMETLRAFTFDDRLSGYSHGEDRDFGFRVSRTRKLAVEERARCIHHGEIGNPANAKQYAYDRTVIEYAWVCEQRGSGLSRAAFLWSAFGEFVLYFGAAVTRIRTRTPDPMGYAMGVLTGLKDIVLRKDPYQQEVLPVETTED